MKIQSIRFVTLLMTLLASTATIVESFCGCATCTAQVLNTQAGGYSCGNRIKFLMEHKQMEEAQACARVGGVEFPAECGQCHCNEDVNKPKVYCGCPECTQQVWDRMNPSCGARISYLTDVLRQSTSQACALVGGTQFPEECGACNPKTCSSSKPVMVAAEMSPAIESAELLPASESTEPLQSVLVGHEDGSTAMTLHRRTPLYCFPSFSERTRFRNVWGRYTVEVKDSGDSTCGPSTNKFSTNTVSFDEEDRSIKLQFKKVGALWEASEVRVRLPEDQMPFVYGRYSFSIKSVQVIDTRTARVIDNVLPPSLVLGLFTWDDTESFADKENMNHEVDIELSRWNIPDNADLQFLVQPPGQPQKARFFSGGSQGTYQQAPRSFSFDWRPGAIEWFGDNGEHHIYSVQHAIYSGKPDFTQCLPADVEVRMNLWNLFGSNKPTGMEDHHMVEVVIDDFSFKASDVREVEEGFVCTKHCQCGSSAVCINNRCRNSRRLQQKAMDYWEQTSNKNVRTDVGQKLRRSFQVSGITVLIPLIVVLMVMSALLLALRQCLHQPETDRDDQPRECNFSFS